MSTHSLNTKMGNGTPVTVVAGWEPGVRSFYLRIEDGIRKLFEHKPGADGVTRRLEFSRLTEELDQFGIRLPRRMVDEIVLDSQLDSGVKNVEWSADGEPIRRA